MSSKTGEVFETLRKAVIIGDTFTRMLNPMSLDMPELLLPICGIPIIEYYIDMLTTSSIKEIIICVKNNAAALKQYIKSHHKKSVNIKVLDSEEFNSVGDCLRKVNTEKLISSDFIMIRGLVVFNVDIDELFNAHDANKKKDKNCIMTSLFKNYKNESCIRTDYDDNILVYNPNSFKIYQYEGTYQKGKIVFNENISFKPNKDGVVPQYTVRSDLFDSGIDICGPEILNILTENFDYHSIRGDFYKNILTSEIYTDTFYMYEVSRDDYIGLIRNPESYLKVNFEILNRWAYPVVVEDLLISPKLKINYKPIDFSIYNDKENKEENYSKANLKSSVLLSKNVIIDEKTSLNYVIVGDNVKIGKNCKLENVIILGSQGKTDSQVVIGDNVEIKNSIISNDVTISDNIKIINSFIGKEISQDTDAQDERIYNSYDPDDNETLLERVDKEIFLKNLEDKEVLFLCTNSNFNEPELNEEDEGNDDDSDSDSDEEDSLDNAEDSEEEDYENELEGVINDGIDKHVSVDIMMKEIAGFKNAYWEKTYAETIKACLKPIITHFMKGESFTHSHIEGIKNLFIEWMPLFKRLVPNEEVEVQLISVIEQLSLEINEISEAFHIIVQVLNVSDVNVIKDEAIKKWNENEVSEYPTSEGKITIPDYVHKGYLEKMKKYIEMNIKH